MAYLAQNFALHTHTNNDAAPWPYGYQSITDNLATIGASGYFPSIRLKVSDTILVYATDGWGIYGVASLNPCVLTLIDSSGISGTVTSVGVSSTTLTIANSPITTSGSIGVNLPATGIDPGDYGTPNVTVDSYGRITTITEVLTIQAVSGDTGQAIPDLGGIAIKGGPGLVTFNSFNADWLFVGFDNIANNTVMANISGSSDTPTEQTMTAIIDSSFSNVQGSVLYRSATEWTALAPGTSGYVLTTAGAAANPSWTSISGGVTGPGTTTDTALALWNGTGGTALANSTITATSNSLKITANGGNVSGKMITSASGVEITSDDTNADITLTPKGTGVINANGGLSGANANFNGIVQVQTGGGFQVPLFAAGAGMLGIVTLNASGQAGITTTDCDANTVPAAFGITATGVCVAQNMGSGNISVTSRVGAADSGKTVGVILFNPNT